MGKMETEEYFIEYNSFHELENSLVLVMSFPEDFGLTRLLTNKNTLMASFFFFNELRICKQ